MREQAFIEQIAATDLIGRTGRVTRILPTYLEADGPCVPLGALCRVEGHSVSSDDEPDHALAEVVSVNQGSVRLAPFGHSSTTFLGARVTAHSGADRVPVGDVFLARAVDALARPIDGLGPIRAHNTGRLGGAITTPLARTSPRKVVETGIRAIDGLLTLGQGQRIGIFAAAGVGKTSLLTQLANQVEADRCVICLVGERGREVEALWSKGLSPETKAKTSLVAATSDQTAAMRVRAAEYALALADHWRQRGQQVLLLLDSATRLAMAMREIGLAAGEPPTVRAYTPGVFAAIPQLVERCGALRSGGSITAIMTILSETDDIDDPVCEMMKSLLDGHIVLTRILAEQGHFPAVDISRSISRLASGLMSDQQRANADRTRQLLSTYDESRTLIETGIYVRGSNPEIDLALDLRPGVMDFLKQDAGERSSLADCNKALAAAVGRGT